MQPAFKFGSALAETKAGVNEASWLNQEHERMAEHPDTTFYKCYGTAVLLLMAYVIYGIATNPDSFCKTVNDTGRSVTVPCNSLPPDQRSTD